MLIIYVDDILVLCDDDDEITYLLGQLEKEYKTIVVERGDEFTYLGMVLKRLKDGSIEMHMWTYIDSILPAYSKRKKIRGYETPGTSSLFDVDVESDILSDTNRKHFHSVVA